LGEFRFFHLERRRVDQALPHLLERAYLDGKRVVVRAASDELTGALNDRLWTYDDASFLPHGASGDGDPVSQPIFLTSRIENPNAATELVLLSGAETDASDSAFAEVIVLFDGRDPESLLEARERWRRLKGENATLSYWREADDGRWERAQ
jgi:DNA polymerase III subunit chi